jgi:RimJ/RimL family protein N-acetyltransferase
MTRSAMRVRLRDVTLADADMLDAWADPALVSEFNSFGHEPTPTPRDTLRHGPLRNERNGTLIVELADGTPIGTVSWHRVSYGPPPGSDAWNIGIELLPSARRKGYGTEAQRLLAGYLFETTPLHRVEASTDVANVAEQRSLEKAGYRREGVQRGAQLRAGAYHDLVTYALLREDP